MTQALVQASFQIASTSISFGERIFDVQGFTSQHLFPSPRDAHAFFCCPNIPGALRSLAIPSGTALAAGREAVQLQHSLDEEPCRSHQPQEPGASFSTRHAKIVLRWVPEGHTGRLFQT